MSRSPQRIEIVGVAGSGKSTLTRTLCERNAGYRVADSLHTRAPSHWRYVTHALPRVLPLAARSLRHRPALSWDELKFVVYVSEWERFLRHEQGDGARVILLDQGPMFALARLLWAKKPVTRTSSFEGWLNEMVERWSTELDAIVWLAATQETLLERINRRDQGHEAKGMPTREGVEVIESHGLAYGRLLERLEGLGRPRVLRFDTSTRTPEEIAADVAEALEPGVERELTEASRAPNVGRR